MTGKQETVDMQHYNNENIILVYQCSFWEFQVPHNKTPDTLHATLITPKSLSCYWGEYMFAYTYLVYFFAAFSSLDFIVFLSLLGIGTFKLLSKCIGGKGFSGTKRYFGDLGKSVSL